MPTAQISSPACFRAMTTSAPSIPFANSWNKAQSLSRNGETEFRRSFFAFFTAHPRALNVTCKKIGDAEKVVGKERWRPSSVPQPVTRYLSLSLHLASLSNRGTFPPTEIHGRAGDFAICRRRGGGPRLLDGCKFPGGRPACN